MSLNERSALGQAGGTQPRIGLQEEGRLLLSSFYSAVRALKLYPLENDAVQQALEELHVRVTGLLSREGIAELRVVGDFFFLNETRLRLDLSNFSTFGSFARILSEHRIGEVAVLRGVKPGEWAPFLSLLLRKPDPDRPFEAFQERLADSPVEHMELRPDNDVQVPDLETEEAKELAKRTYAQSVQTAREVLTDLRVGRAVNVRKVKRAVQSIVDQVLANEPSIMAMTTLREFDEYTFTHSVNVSIFSVIIGQRMGLKKQDLYELGLGALFHDIGKMRLPNEVVNKSGELTDEEWAIMKEHPTEGLLALFQLHGFVDVPYRQMLMAYEHHMKVDLTGYPQNTRPREPGLFSRIVAVADAFDAGTSVRSYQYKPWPPDEVLKEMRDNPRRGFDPVLVKALITATGVYPVGTVVVLDTMEVGVVSEANSDPDHMHQPTVKLITDGMGVPLGEPVEADLQEVDPETGEARRTVIKTVNPDKYGIRVSDVLV